MMSLNIINISVLEVETYSVYCEVGIEFLCAELFGRNSGFGLQVMLQVPMYLLLR